MSDQYSSFPAIEVKEAVSTATNALKHKVSPNEKVSRATSPAARRELPRAFANEQIQSRNTKEAQAATTSRKERRRSVTADYGARGRPVYSVDVAHRIYKRALESSWCRRAKEGSFFDAVNTCHRFLHDFFIHEKDEQCLPPCPFDRSSAKAVNSMVGVHTEAAAERLWDFPEAILCNKAKLHGLQEKLLGLKRNE